MKPAGPARPARARRSRRDRGFTLIEVLIALTVTALIMLGLVSAMATFGKSAERIESRVELADEVRLVAAFLRTTLGRSSRAYTTRLPGGGEAALFRGEAREIRWLGVMPARHGAGGLHLFRLFVADEKGSRKLLLQYLPYRGGGLEPQWASAPSHVLVSDLTRLAVAYKGDDEDAAWAETWSAREQAPDLVQLAIAARGKSWPELVVRVRAADMAGAGVRIVHGPVL